MNRKGRGAGVAIVVVALLGAAVPAHAERLQGQVTDSSGAGVGDALVTVMTAQRAVIATATTAPDGQFVVDGVPPGRYLVSIVREAFEEALVTAEVDGGETPTTIVLDPAAVREEVTVTASPGTVSDPSRAVQPSTVARATGSSRTTTTRATSTAWTSPD